MRDPSENPSHPLFASLSAHPDTSDSLPGVDASRSAPTVAPTTVAPPTPPPLPVGVAPATVAPSTAPPPLVGAASPVVPPLPVAPYPAIAATDVTSDDNLSLFKGLKRLHKEEQTMPIRDSDGNTRPFPVSNPKEIRQAMKISRPLPQPPQGEAASNAGSPTDFASKATSSLQRAPNLTQPAQRIPTTLLSHETKPPGSRATKQLPVRGLASLSTGPREPVDPAPTPLYTSVSPYVSVCAGASENGDHQLLARPLKRFKDIVRLIMHV